MHMPGQGHSAKTADGSLVDLSLGLVNGGGSVLAVQLTAYVAGVSNPHVASEISANALKLLVYGLAIGVFSGIVGIGDGFLLVPGLVSGTGMPIFLCSGFVVSRRHGIRGHGSH
jgi:uncharacterized membrane protein YfcA